MIVIPENVNYIIGQLHSAGYEAYAVGGCVRDSILGREPNDWDITTSALPMTIKSLFNRTVDTGIKHGTVTVLLGSESYEVTTYRIDGNYTDSRHPDSVSFTRSLEEDLKRRDFTINAMAFNEADGVVDMFDGISDLNNRVVRCVGCAENRFGEDALRILRAVRFAAQLDFSIEEQTAAAASKLAPNLVNISAERIHTELYKLLMSARPDMLEDLHMLGIDKYILPELQEVYKAGKGDELEAALLRADALPAIRWAILLKYTGNAKPIMRRLKFDNHTMDAVMMLLRHEGCDYTGIDEYGLRKIMNSAGAENVPLIFGLVNALRPDEKTEKAEKLYGGIKERGECTALKELAVNGRDMMDIGAERGVIIGKILEMLLGEVLRDPQLNTKEKLLALAGERMELWTRENKMKEN